MDKHVSFSEEIKMNLSLIDGKEQVTKRQHEAYINYYALVHCCTTNEATKIINNQEIVTQECEDAWELAYTKLGLGELRAKHGI